MKTLFKYFLVAFLLLTFSANADGWIRINQIGYLTNSIKVAVLISEEEINITSFEIFNSVDNKKILQLKSVKNFGEYPPFKSSYRLDFSELNTEGNYYIKAGNFKSPTVRISNDAYKGTADFLLNYMRQQRCGYNPFLKDSCHTNDGFIVDHPFRTGEYIDVKGGWHDATDYLQYLTTSANAVYQMLFAYLKNPESFSDKFDKDGNSGANGIPDILDEAKWGLDWLVKMNPDSGVMFNQIADDRDHDGFRLPAKDTVNYGKGTQRPIYFVTGKVQGLSIYKNRSTGVSSSAAKFASAFALGSDLLKKYYPEFSELIKKKSVEAYDFAKTDLGVNQTASVKSPYFYEEDNYVDDLELAAAQLSISFNDNIFLKEAAAWGEVEPFTPWMGADTARHYQWYPFINLGHFYLANSNEEKISKRFTGYLRTGLEKIYNHGKDNAFLIGIPFIWCSNNLVAAAITQADLYNEISGDNTFSEMEAALRDWLFGCNPWGTSMVVGLPEDGDYPANPHSSLWVKEKYQTYGGLVDGPVYSSIFNQLAGLQLVFEDPYAKFQSYKHIYHDDYGDYSTNEPTMDGTASLSFYLSRMQALGNKMKAKTD